MTTMSNELPAEENAAAETAPAASLAAQPGDDTVAAAGAGAAASSADEAAAAEEPVAGTQPVTGELLARIVEGALLAAGKPLAVEDLAALFEDDERPAAADIRAALAVIAEQCVGRGFELREVASGFRFQVVQEVAPWIARLWEEKPQKYSRALLETLALIAYRQPITRGDIEDIRGVAVATNIIKTLLERDWVRVVGHKDVPGRPAMYATTRRFLDYFNLKNLDELPALADLRDLDALSAQLSIEGADTLLPEQQEAGEGAEPAAPDAPETIDLLAQATDREAVAGEPEPPANDDPASEAVSRSEDPSASEEPIHEEPAPIEEPSSDGPAEIDDPADEQPAVDEPSSQQADGRADDTEPQSAPDGGAR